MCHVLKLGQTKIKNSSIIATHPSTLSVHTRYVYVSAVLSEGLHKVLSYSHAALQRWEGDNVSTCIICIPVRQK